MIRLIDADAAIKALAAALEWPGAFKEKSALKRAVEAIDALPTEKAESDWLPIESAPKDGTQILACNYRFAHGHIIVFWDLEKDRSSAFCWRESEQRSFHHTDAFTHWMPLREVPELPDEDGGGA